MIGFRDAWQAAASGHFWLRSAALPTSRIVGEKGYPKADTDAAWTLIPGSPLLSKVRRLAPRLRRHLGWCCETIP